MKITFPFLFLVTIILRFLLCFYFPQQAWNKRAATAGTDKIIAGPDTLKNINNYIRVSYQIHWLTHLCALLYSVIVIIGAAASSEMAGSVNFYSWFLQFFILFLFR